MSSGPDASSLVKWSAELSWEGGPAGSLESLAAMPGGAGGAGGAGDARTTLEGTPSKRRGSGSATS